MEFIEDRRGRVPFAVLGVFLLVGSAVTSGIITGLEREHAISISSNSISLQSSIAPLFSGSKTLIA